MLIGGFFAVAIHGGVAISGLVISKGAHVWLLI